ncbi:MAG: sarcosine oxidase subunit delta [Alphaproteobacteria bacterium]|nr:sarcosine oxidase subunit delta [Alphaproteobacteria bacterium]
MFLIDCPYCGTRQQTEFHCHGEAHIARPKDPDAVSDAEWADYMFNRSNTKGVFYERWVHNHGCRRWFNVARDTVSDRILAVYRMGEQPPKVKS